MLLNESKAGVVFNIRFELNDLFASIERLN